MNIKWTIRWYRKILKKHKSSYTVQCLKCRDIHTILKRCFGQEHSCSMTVREKAEFVWLSEHCYRKALDRWCTKEDFTPWDLEYIESCSHY